MHFLLDANMPRSTVAVIRATGHECIHVRDTPLAAAPDDQIASHARTAGLTLITRDFDFADERRYPPSDYPGIAVLVLPDTATAALINQLVASLLRSDCLVLMPGRLAIVDFGRIRLRPKPTMP